MTASQDKRPLTAPLTDAPHEDRTETNATPQTATPTDAPPTAPAQATPPQTVTPGRAAARALQADADARGETRPVPMDPREELPLHLPAMRAFAISLTRNMAAADDLVQDAVVKAWSSFDKFEPGTNMRAWLFTILRNTFYSGVRKRRRDIADPDRHAVPAIEHDAAQCLEVRHLISNRREIPLGIDPRLADRHNLRRIGPLQKCGSLVRLISGVKRMNPDRSIHPRVRAHDLKCTA